MRVARAAGRLLATVIVLVASHCTVRNPDYRTDGGGRADIGCTRRCQGRQCGPDSCGGSCGTCSSSSTCSASGQCIPTSCKPSCAGRQCGDDSCGGTCGACPPSAPTCSSDGRCVPGCTPQCQGKQCGENGCGGTCGACTPPTTCDPTFHCAPPTSCGAVSYQGCCAGTTLKYCQNGVLGTEDCSKDAQCGWNASKKYYDCGTSGQADPSGKFPKACP